MKKLKLLLIFVLVIIVINMPIFAGTISITDIHNNKTISGIDTQVKTIGGKIYGITRTIGVVVSVVMLAVLGVKYMMGSADERAQYKKSMMPYIIGAFCVFSASAIAGVLYEIAKTF